VAVTAGAPGVLPPVKRSRRKEDEKASKRAAR